MSRGCDDLPDQFLGRLPRSPPGPAIHGVPRLRGYPHHDRAGNGLGSELAVTAVVIAWVAILVTGRYPPGLFAFVEGVMRWNNQVIGYACTLVTDQYPPFRLGA